MKRGRLFSVSDKDSVTFVKFSGRSIQLPAKSLIIFMEDAVPIDDYSENIRVYCALSNSHFGIGHVFFQKRFLEEVK